MDRNQDQICLNWCVENYVQVLKFLESFRNVEDIEFWLHECLIKIENKKFLFKMLKIVGHVLLTIAVAEGQVLLTKSKFLAYYSNYQQM